jgi:hypothetical protein
LTLHKGCIEQERKEWVEKLTLQKIGRVDKTIISVTPHLGWAIAENLDNIERFPQPIYKDFINTPMGVKAILRRYTEPTRPNIDLFV